jgi:hypothetical protein
MCLLETSVLYKFRKKGEKRGFIQGGLTCCLLRDDKNTQSDYNDETRNHQFNTFRFRGLGVFLIYRGTENTGIVFSPQNCFHKSSSTNSVVARVIKDLLYNPYRFARHPFSKSFAKISDSEVPQRSALRKMYDFF